MVRSSSQQEGDLPGRAFERFAHQRDRLVPASSCLAACISTRLKNRAKYPVRVVQALLGGDAAGAQPSAIERVLRVTLNGNSAAFFGAHDDAAACSAFTAGGGVIGIQSGLVILGHFRVRAADDIARHRSAAGQNR